jgi:hypothetical protein
MIKYGNHDKGSTPPPSIGGDAPGWVWGFFNVLFSRQGTGMVQLMWFGSPGKNSELLLSTLGLDFKKQQRQF